MAHDRVKTVSVRIAEQLADILTKALAQERFYELRLSIGVLDVHHQA
jgi:hypothetical protein